MIVAHCESANDDSTLYAGAGNFYLIAFAIIKVAVDFAQGEYRQSDGPQAKITDADLAARNHQRIAECIFQMSMGDTNQALNPALELRRVFSSSHFTQFEIVIGKDFPRQPARSICVILPDVFEDVRHL